jgi:polar amino acid transport system substrate-binding protein
MIPVAVAGRALVAALLCLLFANAHGVAEPFRIIHNQPFPPFSELKNGKSEGLAIDILQAAAERVGIELDFIASPLEQMVQMLKDGRGDALLGPNTLERQKVYDFSSPVLTSGGALFVRAPSPTPDGLRALSGKVVVTPRTGPLAAIIKQSAPEVNLSVTTDYDQSLARVVDGTADAAALNFQAGAIIAARLYPSRITIPTRMFLETQNCVAVPKGQHAEVISRLSQGLDAIRADGTWQKINARWMGQ